MKFVTTGLSHRTAPIEIREKLAKATTPLESALQEVLRTTSIDEVCVVSTCNRVEFYATGVEAAPAIARDLRAFITASCGLSPSDIEPHLYEHEGLQGLQHLFRVASSLDSMVLGEPQILGQVKQAYQVAVASNTVGPVLSRVFERTFAVAKRVRTETGIAENAVSMSFAAVELGRAIFDSLEGKNVLLVGAGKMSTLAAKHLRSNGIAEIRVANRSLDRATILAKEIGGLASSLDDLEMLLGRADIVISSTAAPGYVVTKKLMSKVVRARRYRPILFVDLAVPRDIDPEIDDLENVFVYDVDSLEEVVQDNRLARKHEAESAEAIIAEEIDRYTRWARSQQVVPVIKALRAHAMKIANAELDRTLVGMQVETDAKRVRAMSQAIVNKMLHPVLTKLKRRGEDGDPGAIVDALTDLFDLDLEQHTASVPPPAQDNPLLDTNVLPLRKTNKEGG